MINIDSLAKATEAFERLAKKEQRGSYIFPANHSSVTDQKPHFPIHDEAHGRNALARANQFSAAPEWYSGSLQSFVNAVSRAVHAKFPGIKQSEKSKKPGRG